MEEQAVVQRFDRDGREKYMLIHKKPVGPRTAEKLFSLYQCLSETQEPQKMYSAGWAAAEAGLVGVHMTADKRCTYIEAAEDCLGIRFKTRDRTSRYRGLDA